MIDFLFASLRKESIWPLCNAVLLALNYGKYDDFQ